MGVKMLWILGGLMGWFIALSDAPVTKRRKKVSRQGLLRAAEEENGGFCCRQARYSRFLVNFAPDKTWAARTAPTQPLKTNEL